MPWSSAVSQIIWLRGCLWLHLNQLRGEGNSFLSHQSAFGESEKNKKNKKRKTKNTWDLCLISYPEFQRTFWIFQNYFVSYDDFSFFSPDEKLWTFRILWSIFFWISGEPAKNLLQLRKHRNIESLMALCLCALFKHRDPHIILIMMRESWTPTLSNTLLLSPQSFKLHLFYL